MTRHQWESSLAEAERRARDAESRVEKLLAAYADADTERVELRNAVAKLKQEANDAYQTFTIAADQLRDAGRACADQRDELRGKIDVISLHGLPILEDWHAMIRNFGPEHLSDIGFRKLALGEQLIKMLREWAKAKK
jgi:hypothetical protein